MLPLAQCLSSCLLGWLRKSSASEGVQRLYEDTAYMSRTLSDLTSIDVVHV